MNKHAAPIASGLSSGIPSRSARWTLSPLAMRAMLVREGVSPPVLDTADEVGGEPRDVGQGVKGQPSAMRRRLTSRPKATTRSSLATAAPLGLALRGLRDEPPAHVRRRVVRAGADRAEHFAALRFGADAPLGPHRSSCGEALGDGRRSRARIPERRDQGSRAPSSAARSRRERWWRGAELAFEGSQDQRETAKGVTSGGPFSRFALRPHRRDRLGIEESSPKMSPWIVSPGKILRGGVSW